jgi:hypothetical protein
MQRKIRVQCRMAGLNQTQVPAEKRLKTTFGGSPDQLFRLPNFFSAFRLGGVDRRPAGHSAHIAGLPASDRIYAVVYSPCGRASPR